MKSKELPFVREMFDGIAPHYDFLNRLLSLRRDVGWRRVLAEALVLPPNARLLDVACGTADVALEILRRHGSGAVVVGTDFSLQMLRSARPKVLDATGRPRVRLAAADAFAPPFRDSSFDAVTIAFGIRNIQDKQTVLRRFLGLLKPGGQVAVLELATPEAGLLRDLYLSYFNRLLPLLGRLFSKHRFAYTYLPASVAQFPPAAAFARLMRDAGFEQVRYRKLTLGVAVLFIGRKPNPRPEELDTHG
jgi:demethylmenaquinone methyltransferase/2-methoxy-6-polyprenyl-1,4-benzoquinol methylase